MLIRPTAEPAGASAGATGIESWIPTGKRSVALVTASVLLYVVAFGTVAGLVGPIAAALSTIPVVISGASYGLRTGIMAALLSVPANLGLLTLTGIFEMQMLTSILFSAVALAPVGAGAGRLHDLQVALRDALAQAREVRALYEATGNYLVDGLAIVSPSRTILFWNAHLEKIFGVPATDALGRSLDDVLPPLHGRTDDPLKTRRDADAAWEKAQTGVPGGFSARLLGPPTREIAVVIFPVFAEDGAIRAFGRLVRDVTAERDVERAREDLIAVAGHELRGPLGNMMGFTELLLTRNFSRDEQRELLEILLREGRRLNDLLDELLDVERIESGRQPLNVQQVDLSAVVGEAVAALAPDPTRPVEVALPAVLPLVLADSVRVRQVLSNLLSNACKYSPDGGTIHVMAEAVDGTIRIAVRDQGLGIPPESAPRLFQKFARIDSPERLNITGTGLGLAISRAIVEQHSGRIWAESAGPGSGTTFAFTLPVVDGEQASLAE